MSKSVGYIINTALLAAVPLAAIPVLLSILGADRWSQIALGQAIGVMLAIFTGSGWAVVGPFEIAHQDAKGRNRTYLVSLYARAALFLVLCPALAATCLLLVKSGEVLLASLAGLTVMFGALSPTWYFVGRQSPLRLIFLETAPKTVVSVVGLVMSVGLNSALPFLLLQPVGYLLGLFFSSVWIVRGDNASARVQVDMRYVFASMRGNQSALAYALLNGAFQSIPVVALSQVLGAGFASYAFLDKLLRQAASAVAPLVQSLQSAVAHPSGPTHFRRGLRALTRAIVLAIVLGLGFAILSPWVLPTLSAGAIEIKPSWVLLTALLIAVTFVEQVANRVLLASTAREKLLLPAAVGFPLGIAASFVGAIAFDVGGAIAGLMLGEALAAALALYFWWRSSDRG